jgi:CheY-like chemotaxis protein
MGNNQELEPKLLRILIAEDNDDVCKLYRLVLTHRGHKVDIAKSAEECLKIFVSHLDENDKDYQFYDVVLLDYALPGKTGAELAKEISNLMPNQRLIFSSAYTEKLISELQKINLVAEIYPKFSDLKSFLDFVEANKN